MTWRSYRSKCCDAKVRAQGIPDFPGTKEVCTVNFSCIKCGKPCDVKGVGGRTPSEKLVAKAKKRIRKQEQRLDFQGEVLKKLNEFLDGITISPTKEVILTSKKKRQLVELQKMEKKLLKKKAPSVNKRKKL